MTRQALLDLQTWMQPTASPAPVAFDEAAAERGFRLFHGAANCSNCHATAEFTGSGAFTEISNPQGNLLVAGGIRIPGLRGVAHTAACFHDGSAATLGEVIDRLEAGMTSVPSLSDPQKADLVEYLESL